MKQFRLILAGFLCFLVFQTVPGSFATLPAEDPTMTAFDKEVFITLINQVRQKESYCNHDLMPAVEPVIWCDTLARAALKHCKDMYFNDFYCHTGSDGSNSGQRVLEQGYRWRACAENLYKGNANETRVFYRWFGSEGHCKNMMHGSLRRVGVARYGEYWAMVLTN